MQHHNRWKPEGGGKGVSELKVTFVQPKLGVSTGGVQIHVDGIDPDGTLDITQNGVYDIKNYAFVNVSVNEGEQT